MATAAATYETKTKIVTVEERVPTVTLVLSKDEAETLAAITYRTAGDPRNSPREKVEAIGVALRDAGVLRYSDYDLGHPSNLVDDAYTGGGIRFLDYPRVQAR